MILFLRTSTTDNVCPEAHKCAVRNRKKRIDSAIADGTSDSQQMEMENQKKSKNNDNYELVANISKQMVWHRKKNTNKEIDDRFSHTAGPAEPDSSQLCSRTWLLGEFN